VGTELADVARIAVADLLLAAFGTDLPHWTWRLTTAPQEMARAVLTSAPLSVGLTQHPGAPPGSEKRADVRTHGRGRTSALECWPRVAAPWPRLHRRTVPSPETQRSAWYPHRLRDGCGPRACSPGQRRRHRDATGPDAASSQ
jgi:hypothetical protein